VCKKEPAGALFRASGISGSLTLFTAHKNVCVSVCTLQTASHAGWGDIIFSIFLGLDSD